MIFFLFFAVFFFFLWLCERNSFGHFIALAVLPHKLLYFPTSGPPLPFFSFFFFGCCCYCIQDITRRSLLLPCSFTLSAPNYFCASLLLIPHHHPNPLTHHPNPTQRIHGFSVYSKTEEKKKIKFD